MTEIILKSPYSGIGELKCEAICINNKYVISYDRYLYDISINKRSTLAEYDFYIQSNAFKIHKDLMNRLQGNKMISTVKAYGPYDPINVGELAILRTQTNLVTPTVVLLVSKREEEANCFTGVTVFTNTLERSETIGEIGIYQVGDFVKFSGEVTLKSN